MNAKTNLELDPETKHNLDQWLEGDYDAETKAAIQKMMRENPKAVVDAFYTHLTFGTGGMRGIMGVGSNRMNTYTVTAATQGLANYLLTQPAPAEGHSVFIGYDSREHSKEFAEESAKVLAASGIHVYLFPELRPTPLVSFGCRFKKCSSAIMITASHNPPEYNGYKVYWNDGAQILPPHDKNIIKEVEKIASPDQVKRVDSLQHPLIHIVGKEVDEAYLEAIHPLLFYQKQDREEGQKIKVVYTSLHGTGITMVPKAFERWGFTNLIFVKEQIIPDGTFPTVRFPNPEERSALKLGIDTMLQTGADLLIANDPDADRVGVALMHQGEVVVLNGNQIACVLLEHCCEALTKQNRMPQNAAFIKTIATTELFQAICDGYQKICYSVLTGFKYIAEKIHQWDHDHAHQYIFGGEESYGYLLGTKTRDKDAITASGLICEAALQAKLRGETLVDRLYAIYRKHGFFLEKLLSVNFEESKEGKERMLRGIDRLQHTPPKAFCGIAVVTLEDYKRSIKTDLATGKQEPLTLPKSDVLVYWLENGTKLMVRPSGTEPKIKIYCGVRQNNVKDIEEARKQCDSLAEALMRDLEKHLQA